MNKLTADDMLKSRVQPEQVNIISLLRLTVLEIAPDAREVVVNGMPGYKRNNMLAVVSPIGKKVFLAFPRGAAFVDKYGLLCGGGSESKNLKFKQTGDVNKDVLGYYIRQAVELDRQ
jgi:hypothetical protein